MSRSSGRFCRQVRVQQIQRDAAHSTRHTWARTGRPGIGDLDHHRLAVRSQRRAERQVVKVVVRRKIPAASPPGSDAAGSSPVDRAGQPPPAAPRCRWPTSGDRRPGYPDPQRRSTGTPSARTRLRSRPPAGSPCGRRRSCGTRRTRCLCSSRGCDGRGRDGPGRRHRRRLRPAWSGRSSPASRPGCGRSTPRGRCPAGGTTRSLRGSRPSAGCRRSAATPRWVPEARESR